MLRRFASLSVLLVPAFAAADVKLSGQFSDHMVVQRDQPMVVWGTADHGETVTVSFAGATAQAVTRPDGKWRVELPAKEASADGQTLKIAGKNTIELADVLIGDVWICSGQSNMEWDVRGSGDPEKTAAEANYPLIRLLDCGTNRHSTTEKLDVTESKWDVCDPKTVATFSAVGYHFGKRLQTDLNVPIGLIDNAWGGMPSEAFTPVEALRETKHGRAFLNRWELQMSKYPEQMKKYEADLAAWENAAPGPDGKKPGKPGKPAGPNAPWGPGNIWNGTINPIIGLPIKGVIWYQGESNAEYGAAYRYELQTMINAWRDAWKRTDDPFPFLIVQLASHHQPPKDPNEKQDWADLRDSQTWVTKNVAKTGQVVITDVGDAKDIHPKDKKTVGTRLGDLALRDVYGKTEVVASGPELESASVDGEGIRLKFKGDRKLVLKGDKGFAVAGADGKFFWATPTLEGDTIVVKSPDVKEPKFVRYNWADYGEGLLFNDAGWPAGPFRTDELPLVTIEKI